MKYVLSILLIIMLSFSLLAEDGKEDGANVKTFDFEAADIDGNKKKPAGSTINSLRDTNQGTKIKPRKNFLPELSNTIDDL